MAATAHAVHTCARLLDAEPDMFGPDTTASANVMEITGRLVDHATVRVKAIDRSGHMAPVLCFDAVMLTMGQHVLHCEQPFTDATRHQAEALAATLRKGMDATFKHPLEGMRISLPNVFSITVQQP